MKRRLLAAALALAAAFTLVCAHALPVVADQLESRIGADVYAQLERRGTILHVSPLYGPLNVLGARIKRVADARYDTPFTFVLIHDDRPNAFSVPGGNVYVTDSLVRFVKSQEQLGGVLCHEVSHTLHHDVTTLMRKNQQIGLWGSLLSVLLGGKQSIDVAINLASTLQSLEFSRDVERRADLTGSDVCAASGVNPWGLVWMLRQFGKDNSGGVMEMLSDHPRDDHRISDLTSYFAANPQTFAHFSSSQDDATPLQVSP